MVNLATVKRDKSMTDDEISALLWEKKMYVTSGVSYRSDESGWFRIAIAHPKSVLDEGLQRITKIL
ncbi:hypothetical protein QL093DRAFT_2210533 [Fusarium oxysporum]|nr:hypothetical protein QL093DRAFT_2210533 [Fusarium oxysporum]